MNLVNSRQRDEHAQIPEVKEAQVVLKLMGKEKKPFSLIQGK